MNQTCDLYEPLSNKKSGVNQVLQSFEIGSVGENGERIAYANNQNEKLDFKCKKEGGTVQIKFDKGKNDNS